MIILYIKIKLELLYLRIKIFMMMSLCHILILFSNNAELKRKHEEIKNNEYFD